MAVADVYPRGLHDELIVGEIVADVHIGQGHEVARDTDVSGFASLVLTARDATNEGVDTRLTVTTSDSDGASEVLTEGFEDVLTEEAQAIDDLLRRLVRQTMLGCRGRASEL